MNAPSRSIYACARTVPIFVPTADAKRTELATPSQTILEIVRFVLLELSLEKKHNTHLDLFWKYLQSYALESKISGIYRDLLKEPFAASKRASQTSGASFALSQFIQFAVYSLAFWCVPHWTHLFINFGLHFAGSRSLPGRSSLLSMPVGLELRRTCRST